MNATPAQVPVQNVDVQQLVAQAAMAAAQQVAADQNRRPLVEREESEDEESIDFVKNGWVRFMIAGQRYRTRRPLFGELRDLRTALEAQVNELTALRQTTELEGNQRGKIRARLEADMAKVVEEMDTGELTDELLDRHSKLIRRNHELLNAGTEAARKLTQKADDLRADWFRQVFERLGVDNPKAPEHLPSWVGDANLPAELMAHWRSAPLGRGPA